LVHLPKYSPDLNPIEYIWKKVKRVISRNFIKDITHMRELIRCAFLENASKLSFAGYWIERLLGGDYWYNKLGS
jgi:putative transposase